MKTTLIKLTHVLGIDVAKKTFQVALASVEEPGKTIDHNFDNTAKGHRALLSWLRKRCKTVELHACMEATGPCGDELATFLDTHIARLSVEQPRRIKGYANCRMMRSKSDPADARMIAHYCATQKPRAWKRPGGGQLRLRAASRRRDSLIGQLHAEKNRLGQTSDPFVCKDIRTHLRHLEVRIAVLEKEIRAIIKSDEKLATALDLLTSIGGIGITSASIILAEIPDVANLDDARQLAAYAGVTPRHHQSGTSGSTHTPMSKNGSARLRKALFYPAMSALRFNPVCQTFGQRLLAKGKKKIVVIGAVMTKLMHLIFGVLKSGKPFDAKHHLQYHPKLQIS